MFISLMSIGKKSPNVNVEPFAVETWNTGGPKTLVALSISAAFEDAAGPCCCCLSCGDGVGG
jgi:hypothetical protein